MLTKLDLGDRLNPHARRSGFNPLGWNPVNAWMVWCPMFFAVTLAVVTHAPVIAQPPVQLPGESELPSSDFEPDELPGEEVLAGDEDAQLEKANASLPGEDEIPGRAEVVQGDGGPDTSAPIGGKAPILRLAFDGHTGVVRTLDISDDGRTLITAGEDKDVHVWKRIDLNDTGWLHSRTIRWPVTRGPRGLIYSARLKGDLAAFAGYGAFGSKGEIRIVDLASGELRVLTDEQEGHLANVLSLAWSPQQEPRLASVDKEGRLIVWQADPNRGIWVGKTILPVDEKTYGAAVAGALKQAERRSFAPITFAGPNFLVAPRFVGPAAEPKGAANWHLQRYDVRTEKSVLLNQLDHIKHVRALAATDDGRVLASCDFGGSIGVWTFDASGVITSYKSFKPETPPLCLDLDKEGKRLLVGTELKGSNAPAKLQLWDVEVATPKLLSERNMDGFVRAGVIDEEHRQVIVSQGIHVEMLSLDGEGKFIDAEPKRLTIPARPVQRVAFAKDAGSYKIAFAWNRNREGEQIFDGIFDPTESKLLGRAPVDADEFLPAQRTNVRWQVAPVWTNEGYRYRLTEGDQDRGMLPLLIDRHGAPTTVCTLPAPARGNEDPGENPPTGAVVVGTGGEYGIYVYEANATDPPELLRQFRDHSGAITSVSTSSDGKYLVSGAGDATISIWNLQDIFTSSKSVNRWGADFEIEGGQLIATNVREDGPLYFRGVRGGDRLMLIEWPNNDFKTFAESDPEKMRARLQDLAFDLLVRFKFTRFQRPGPDFQSLAAWRPLATLFVDQTREWAFWTPAGYYNASVNGHQRFGWQINSSVDRPVEYVLAAQFQNLLERPDIMRRLLAAESLPAAMRKTVTQIGPPPAEGAIVNQVQSKPKIRLLSPDPSKVIEGDTLTIRAEIGVPRGATLVDPKAFISGVPAVHRQVVDNSDNSDPDLATYEWRFRLPSDKRLQLEILAATESKAMDRVLVDLERKPGAKPAARPRLHLLAIGASKYRDPQIPSLDFAAKAAGDMADLFRNMSSRIYQTSADQLVNTDATRPLWRVFAQNAAEELSQTVSPDDLVVMYLCGHGWRDRRTNQWYFVTADARYNDLMHDRYSDCIAFSDLAALAKLPCRKLAILDSCHSGAVQPLMRRDDLKSALRFLQDDVVLTVTASEGDELAAEQRETQLGRFTSALVGALSGEARELDDDSDTVSLTEAIEYVTRRVTAESEAEGMSQHPTASPSYLLRTLQLPLTSRPAQDG